MVAIANGVALKLGWRAARSGDLFVKCPARHCEIHVKTMWAVLRRLFAILLLVVGLSLIFAPGPGFWLRASLGIFTCGSAVRWFAFDRRLVGGRQILGFSLVRGWRLMCVAYIAAGGCAMIGAFTSLETAFAWILTPFLVGWISFWVWVLRRYGGAQCWHGPPKRLPG